jgi:regulator of sigma E protease
MIATLSTIGLILLAIALLLVMITIHEFGHYTAGKLLGFKIYEFSIGFGKAIFKKKKKNGEVFAVRMIPLGGYCSFGEDDAGTGGTAGKLNLEKDDPQYYYNKAPWKRLIVLFMGAFFNFLSAIVFAVALLCIIGYSRVSVIHYITPEIAAELGENIQAGSLITTARIIDTATVGDDGEPVYTYKAVWEAGDSILLTILEPSAQDAKGRYVSDERQIIYTNTTEEQHQKLQAIVGTKDKKGTAEIHIKQINGKGMTFLPTTGADTILKSFRAGNNIKLSVLDGGEIEFVNASSEQSDYIKNNSGYSYNDGVYHNFWGAVKMAVPAAFEMAWLILTLLFQLVTGQLGMAGVAGTVGTVATMGETLTAAASFGFTAMLSQMLFLVTLISINLAVFNWLPIPSLDGARMVFTAIEWVRKKPINRDLEAKIHFIGIMCLLAFVIFADIYWTISRFKS